MSDLISRQDAIRWVKTECNPYGKPTLDFESGKKVIEHLRQMPSADRPKGMIHIDEVYNLIAGHSNYHGDSILSAFTCLVEGKDVKPIAPLNESADRPTVDCTEFMEWLKAEVLNEENWELNAVANGEIICRKFKKLGWLDVEDGFYVDARPTGEWIPVSEKLPKEDGYYLVTWEDEDGRCTLCDYYRVQFGFGKCVKAWMPLPKSYKGGDSDG